MKQLSCLKQYDLTLTVRGPVFVGSGEKYGKKDYLYVPSGRKVTFVDQHLLFEMLIQKDLVDRYEAFMLGGDRTLSDFLRKDCGLSQDEIASISSYTVRAGDALDAQHALKEIHKFIRNAEGRAYLPGSSVKGALRTALLAQQLLKGRPHGEREILQEERYFNVLRCLKKDGRPDTQNAVNSIMRGISVADSQPVPDKCMTLSAKIDLKQNGEKNAVNVCRECIAPGTVVHAALTLDDSVLSKSGWTAETILEAVEAFAQCQKSLVRGFRLPNGAMTIPAGPCLLLGGGAGFLSKTAVYPFYGPETGRRKVSESLSRSFRNHHHERDRVSPRMLKYTSFGGRLCPFGLCEVKLS